MIPMIALGASGLAAALMALSRKDENEDGFTGNEAVLFNDSSETSPEERKATKKLATASEGVLQQVREHISQAIPEDFNYSLRYGRGEEVVVTWQHEDVGMTPRIPQIADDNLWSVLKQLQAVDWDNERKLAEASESAFRDFCDKCHELQEAFPTEE